MEENVNNTKEINIGWIGITEEIFKEIIINLSNSSFFQDFSLINNIINYAKYSKASFKKINPNKIINPNNHEDYLDNLVINIIICQGNLKDDKKKEYENILEETIDYFLIFEKENIDINFLNLIYKFSKGNCLNLNGDYIITSKSKVFKNFAIIEDNNQQNNKYYNSKEFKFEQFLKNIIEKYNMFILFQKYSVEKNIITFKDYLCILMEYSTIKDEKELIKLFNNFEKLSFNNDYTDNALILIQLLSYKKTILNNEKFFNVKSLKCGFCTEKLNICEFDPKVQTFLCYRCRYHQYHYNKIVNNN